MISEPKKCHFCDKPVKGRADKKFCDDYCRNSFNNQSKATSNNLIRNISNALKKNRSILEGLLQDQETQKVARDKLVNLGFQFKYQTHTYLNKKGNQYFFCYDFGYLELENNMFLIVRNKN